MLDCCLSVCAMNAHAQHAFSMPYTGLAQPASTHEVSIPREAKSLTRSCFAWQVQEKVKAGLVPMNKYIITKQLTKRPEDYPDARNQAHVQVALRRRAAGKRDGVMQVCLLLLFMHLQHAKEKKRRDYAFWRQFNEKPSIIPGCPGSAACICLSPDMQQNKAKKQQACVFGGH